MLFRIYKSVLAAVNKTQEGHPFRVSEIIPLRCEESSDIEWVRSSLYGVWDHPFRVREIIPLRCEGPSDISE